jgi:mono/diheme cytochrome c family protein
VRARLQASLGALMLALVAGALGLACVRPGGPGNTNEFGPNPTVFTTALECLPLTTSEPLPARAEVTAPSLAGSSDGNLYFTSTLFGQFKSICGSCHVGAAQGGFSVSEATFSSLITQSVIDDYIKSPDPKVFMPPSSDGGKTYAQRGPTDPVVEMVGLLQIWIAQGSPPGTFSLAPSSNDGGVDGDARTDGDAARDVSDAGDGADGDASDVASSAGVRGAPAYTLSPELGGQLTNIGSCLPSRYAVGLDGAKMDKLDTFFAAATELPDTLDETDLTTFDSDALARTGVVSYVPTYPLWSDDAGKMRHVRPPRHQSIVFDKAAQRFQIPPNTRFYKTFFKQVIDATGKQAFKRIETRLIVSRPDVTLADGTISQTALFGTYVWNEAETSAELLKDPLRSGDPFADRVISYITDEPRAAAIIATHPPNVDYVLETENPGLVRHYALPSSTRCVQCHMGSPSAAFVLGFTPLQVATKAPGYSGVIEPATSDELTQLQRLIDYGVISGMNSPADVLPLEQTQLPRTPRNDDELRAQAYMVGNCAHCHNPRGFPSTKAPELKDVLDFLPGPSGGVFQFPLDRVSPVRARGLNQDVPVPYLTPSLRDYLDPLATTQAEYTPKYVACGDKINDNGWCTTAEDADFIDAPWRSLIYRNVDAPFDYVDDLAIFPHMPMNTPGYDCRVAQIMGDWMVSIPAVRVNTDKTKKEDSIDPATVDDTPQPYAEVKPGDSGYAAALTAAQQRLATYHAGHRYNFCPNTGDILDPRVVSGDYQTPPDLAIGDLAATPPQLTMPAEGVPDRAHWVITDATDPPGDWLPRGSQWPKVLEQGQGVVYTSGSQAVTQLKEAQELADDLESVTLDDATRKALLTEVPFALWKPDPSCDFTGTPTVSALPKATAPAWTQQADPNAPVYFESPGAALFTNICINCHGPQADAKGLLADEISIMTGGDAQVANFRTGLFGPTDSPGANRQRVFGGATAPNGPTPIDAGVADAGGAPDAIVTVPISPDDMGARYMSWMALGGTSKSIPQGLLSVVASTGVAGQHRSGLITRASPNMLQLVQELCTHVAPVDILPLSSQFFLTGATGLGLHDLIASNGDAELWLEVCSLNNRPIVRVIAPDSGAWDGRSIPVLGGGNLFWGTGDGSGDVPYPSSAPVMDQRGHVVNGITADNVFPICVRQPIDAAQAKVADDWVNANPVRTPEGAANKIPYCPKELFATEPGPVDGVSGQPTIVQRWVVPSSEADMNPVYDGANRWADRGAINAGLAVFLYVDQLSKGLIQPQILYNQCALLKK